MRGAAPSTPPGGGASSRAAAARPEPLALFAIAALAILFSWWAWQEGAYFPAVLLPGVIALGVGLIFLCIAAPLRIDLRPGIPVAAALTGLAGLAAWAGLSALWSPTPDVALLDALRNAAYAICFGAGIWIANLLGPRMGLSLLPLTAAGAFAGGAAALALATGGDPRSVLEVDGTLDYPLGYRNANAAFFAIALLAAVGLSLERGLKAVPRAAGLATASLCLALFLLCQSRGSLPALLVALTVLVLAAPVRVRLLSWLGLAALPALATLPATSALYTAVGDERMGAVGSEMHAAGVAVLLATAAAFAAGLIAIRFERRLPGFGADSPRSNRRVGLALAAGALAGAAAFVVAVGDPIDWFDQRLEEFQSVSSPELEEQSTRFSVNAGSDRADLWGVALDLAADDPLLGEGAGGYSFAYLRARETDQNALDAHSFELETLSELGLPGLALVLAGVGGALMGAFRARRLGPSAASLSAIALAVGAYWLVHCSVDWFWAYPAVTAPVLGLLGAASAGPVRALAGSRRTAFRRTTIAIVSLLAVIAVPLLFADRYVDRARTNWRADLDAAYDNLDRARRLNPLSDAPLLAEGAIAREAGDEERALAAFREAADKRPDQWAVHYLLAELLAERDPAAAAAEIERARELNPRSLSVQELASELGLDGEPDGG